MRFQSMSAFALLTGIAFLIAMPALSAQNIHTEEHFTFTAKAPFEQVVPLFGAHQERAWSPGWNPEFVYPTPPADRQGMVFRVRHGDATAIWVNTIFDPKAGLIQYVYTLPGILTTVITIHATPHANTTEVAVEYDRTSLQDSAADHVRHLAEKDRTAGPEWERQMNEFLNAKGAAAPPSR